MAEQENKVYILSWPESPAKLEHRFDPQNACPVSIAFEERPANIVIQTSPREPLNVDMDMHVSAREPIPVCIKLCEPICARSDYAVGITLFDRPVAAISVRGQTKLFNCQDGGQPTQICMDFKELKPGIEFTQPFVHQNLTFSPLGDPIHTGNIGDPPNITKLQFPKSGIRVDFPGTVNNVTMLVNNYANPTLEFTVFSGSSIINQFNVDVNNEVKTIEIPETGITAVEIQGGSNEASIIQICYFPAEFGKA